MFITRKDIQRNPDVLFVFGDNTIRKGMGGMAKEFRGEPNTIGIRTKKTPKTTKDAYFTDDEYEKNIILIEEDITAIKKEAKDYCAVWIPDSIGSGLAKMDEKAPKTFEYLLEKLEELRVIYN